MTSSRHSSASPGFQDRVIYVQNGAHFARRRVARAQVRASEALRLLGKGVWGQAPELETRNLKKNKKFSFNIYSGLSLLACVLSLCYVTPAGTFPGSNLVFDGGMAEGRS